jgi:hypothetical protein
LSYFQDPNPEKWSQLREIFLNLFLDRFKEEIFQGIPLLSISLIFRILLGKEREIKEISKRSAQIALATENY